MCFISHNWGIFHSRGFLVTLQSSSGFSIVHRNDIIINQVITLHCWISLVADEIFYPLWWWCMASWVFWWINDCELNLGSVHCASRLLWWGRVQYVPVIEFWTPRLIGSWLLAIWDHVMLCLKAHSEKDVARGMNRIQINEFLESPCLPLQKWLIVLKIVIYEAKRETTLKNAPVSSVWKELLKLCKVGLDFG